MPRFIFSPHIEISLRHPRREPINERRDRYRGKLKIVTPEVSEELRKRWYGAPPTKIELQRRTPALAF